MKSIGFVAIPFRIRLHGMKQMDVLDFWQIVSLQWFSGFEIIFWLLYKQ